MKLVTLGPYSLLLRPRALLVALVMLGVLTLIGFALLGTGTLNVPPLDVARTLIGLPPDMMAERIIWQIRLPRLLTAILVGAALGVAGAVFQSISRNALGSPDVIGFTSGAATGAIVQIILFNAGPWLTAVSAMASGMAVAVIVLLLSRRDGGGRLVLVGIGFGALLAGINTVLLVMGNLDQAASAQLWLAGSLNMRGWTHVATIGVGIACLLPPILALSRQLNILEMGDDTAAQLGLHPERLRLVMVLLAVGMTAFATAIAGPIAFIALAGPQIAKRLTRAPDVPIITGALAGAVLLAAADLISQRFALGVAMPVGLTTGLIGGLYLVVFTFRRIDRG
ncbi:FecCD family ABC transporter permease [Ketogulonicigenium vulgare]|uniref:FecCD family ABC transporter permease n=1 Tax=Ketogulonicigenium vulgare TaxID=92945 RepID=UPI002359A6CB|nr:iron chelate uptake ABC transporter family permease subunit [Ketogulonicigenium vulgare]